MSNTTENTAAETWATEKDAAANAVPMTVEARVRPIAPKENLLGFASVTINDCLVIEGLRIRQGKSGINVGMPGAYDEGGKWRDTCKPITSEFQKQIAGAVREEYAAAIERMEETVAATKDAVRSTAKDERQNVPAAETRGADAAKSEKREPAADKPASSLADTLKKNAEKAKAQPVKTADAKAAQAL